MSEYPQPLNNLTTEYIEQEDRIRLSGATCHDTAVIWLTQRLFQRLLPLLIQWLERQQPSGSPVTARFAFMRQQTIQAEDKAVTNLSSWLANSIDIATTNEQVVIIFRGVDGQAASVIFSSEHLQQWLEILHETCLAAQWPLNAWSSWMVDGAMIFRGQESVLWH